MFSHGKGRLITLARWAGDAGVGRKPANDPEGWGEKKNPHVSARFRRVGFFSAPRGTKATVTVWSPSPPLTARRTCPRALMVLDRPSRSAGEEPKCCFST